MLFTCIWLIPFPNVFTVNRHSWWPPIIIILLCWLSSRQPILPRPHHAHPAILLCLPSQVAEHKPGLLIRQTTPEWGSASPIGHNCSPTLPASSCTASTTISHCSPTSLSPLSKQLSTNSSSSGGAHAQWHSRGANWATSELSGVISESNH